MKKNTKKIALFLTSALAGSGMLASALVALVSCNKSSAIPTEFLKVENGMVTGFTKDVSELSNYKTLLIPEKDKDGNAITGIAANAFRQLIGNEYGLQIETITIKKNVKKIETNAFYGCHTVKTIDLSDYGSDDEINSLMSDENLGVNAFALMNSDEKGSVKLNNAISDKTKNDTKVNLILAGVPSDWYKPEEKPAISSLKMVSASTTLKGKEYFSGKDTKAWGVTYEGVDVTKNCDWSITPKSHSFPEGQITISKTTAGEPFTQWTSEVVPGIYEFDVVAAYKLPDETVTKLTATETVTLIVTETPFTINGPTSASGKSFITGKFTEPFVTKFDSAEITPEYSIKNDSTGLITIDKDGYVSWGELAVGSHAFNVEAKYKFDAGDKVKTLTVESNEARIAISDRKVTITPPTFPATVMELGAGKSITPVIATVTDDSTNNAVTWTLNELSGNPTKDSLWIDSDGYVNWKSDVQTGVYSFTVTALVDGKWQGISETIQLNVNAYDSVITGGERSKTTYDYTPGYGTTRSLEVNDVAIPNVKWSLSGNVPSGVYIDENDGHIYWNGTVHTGTYNMTVDAYCADYKGKARTASKDFTLYVNTKEYIVSGGNQTILTKEYTAGQDSKAWTAKVNDSANETQVWSLVPIDPEKPLPSGLGIENGRVKWDDTVPSGTYRFYVRVTVDNHWFGESALPVTMTIDKKTIKMVEPDNKQLSAEDYHSGSSTQQWKVMFDEIEDVTSQIKKWTFIPSQGSAVPNGIGVDASGHITWDDKVDEGTYKFTMTATYEYHGEERTTSPTSEITFTVTKTPVTIEQSNLKTQFNGDIGAAGSDASTTWTVKVDDEIIPSSRIKWYFLNDQYESVLPNQINIDGNGHLTWGNSIAVGDHKFYVWALVDGHWYGQFTTEMTLTITGEHDLVNADLAIDGDGYVTGFKTNISGYKEKHSLTIHVDGNTVKGIKTLKHTDNDRIIESLIIETDVDLDLRGAETFTTIIELARLTSISVKSAAGKTTYIDLYTFFGNDDVSSRRFVETLSLDGVHIGDYSFGTPQSIYAWRSVTKLTLANVRYMGIEAFSHFGSKDGCEIVGLDNVFGATTHADLTNAHGAFYSSTIKFEGDLTIAAPYVPYEMFGECQFFAPNLIVTDKDASTGCYIDYDAFAKSKVKSLYLKNASHCSLMSAVFNECPDLATVKFNGPIAKMDDAPFFRCTSLNTIDLTEMSVTTAAEAKFATEMNENAWGNIIYPGVIKCKDLQASKIWYQTVNGKFGLSTKWTFTPYSAWNMKYELTGLSLSKAPSTWTYENDFDAEITLNEGFELNPSSYIVIGDTKYTSEIPNVLEFHADKTTGKGRVFIASSKLQEAKTGSTVTIHLHASEPTEIETVGTAYGLCKQVEVDGDYYARIRRFRKTDNIALENIRVSAKIYNAATQQYIDSSKYSMSILEDMRYADCFNVYIRFDKKAVATQLQLGVLICEFEFTDTNTLKTWTFSNIEVLTSMELKEYGSEAFNVENNIIKSVKNEMFDSYNAFSLNLIIDGTNIKGIDSNALKTFETYPAQVVTSLFITIEQTPTAPVILSKDTVHEYITLWYGCFTNKTSDVNNLQITDDILCGVNKSMEKMQFENVVISNAFHNLNRLNTVVIKKGTKLNSKAFYDLEELSIIDLSDWDAVPTNWASDAFSNICPDGTAKTIYIKDMSLKDAWIAYLKGCGLTDVETNWTFVVE